MVRYNPAKFPKPKFLAEKIRKRTKSSLGQSTKDLTKLKNWYEQIPVGARIGDRKQQQRLKKKYEATGKKIEKINRDVKKLMSSQEVKKLIHGYGW